MTSYNYSKLPEVLFYSDDPIVPRGNDYKIKFAIDPPKEVPSVVQIPYETVYKTSLGNLYSVSLKLSEWSEISYVSSVVKLFDDFENGIRLPLQGKWHVTNQQAYKGNYSLRSNQITHNSSTDEVMTITLNQDALLSFMYKVRSESRYDYFDFYINGVRQIHASGNGSWTKFTKQLSPGNYTFLFRYLKDGSVSRYEDCVFIDDLEISYLVSSKLLIRNGNNLYTYQNGWVNVGTFSSDNEELASLIDVEGFDKTLQVSLQELNELGEDLTVYVLSKGDLDTFAVAGLEFKDVYFRAGMESTFTDSNWEKVPYNVVTEVEKVIPITHFTTSEMDYKFLVQVKYGDDVFSFEKLLRLYNTDHFIDIKVDGLQVYVKIVDNENDSIRYRVLLNDEQVYPLGEAEYTDFIDGGRAEYSRLFLSSDVLIGELNTITVIAEDIFGRVVTRSKTFGAEYVGLLFADMNNELYSTDLGKVLKYLEVGPLMAGTSSLIYPIKLINKYRFPVTNIRLIQENIDNSDIILEFCENEVPFIGKDSLSYSDTVLNYNDELIFYVRVSSKPATLSGGMSNIVVRADPAN